MSKMGRPKGSGDDLVAWISVRATRSLRDALKELASDNDRSYSDEVRIALRQHLKENGAVLID